MKRRFLLCVFTLFVVAGFLNQADAQQSQRRKSSKKATAAAKSAAPARSSGRAAIADRSKEPYLGAIVVDADTGAVLFEDGADVTGYPASVIKLMDLLVIQERIEAGQLSLSNRVTVTAEASRIGGSQVYLAEKEVFTIEDLLYALMIQSANDAATALALHVGGTTGGFVELMNRRASELGMTNTHFYSCHGLPPAAGVNPDMSTARDLSVLARELLKHPDVLQYTSTRERGFRNGQFIMRTHNHLLTELEGCDGFKTGYFTAGGFSIVATVQRGGRRVIAVVLGSRQREVRDVKAKEMISKGFLDLPPLPPPVTVATNVVTTNAPAEPAVPVKPRGGRWRLVLGIVLGVVGVATAVVFGLGMIRRPDHDGL